MSVQMGVTCLDCRSQAPGVGDGGFLGAPELTVPEDCPVRDEPMPSFGFFMEGLSAIHVRPYDLERYKEWLVVHSGHRLFLSSDDDQDDWPAELLAIEEEDRETNASLEALQAYQAERKRRAASGEFIVARHRLDCDRCGAGVVSSDTELLLSMVPTALEPHALQLFLDRWTRDPDIWSHRLFGLVDPCGADMEALLTFAKVHNGHPCTARLVPVPE